MPVSVTRPASVKSADRVLTMFELLGSSTREMSHSDIADAMSIPKSSLTQLLKNLVGRGWLTYQPASKGYSIGPSLTRIVRRAHQQADLTTLAGQVLAVLTEQTSESSALNMLKDDVAEVVCTVLGPQRLVSHMRLGDVAPLYATSGGKAILAFLPPERQDRYLRQTVLTASTQATLTSVEQLRKQLEDVRESGLAFSRDEWSPGITGMACPLLSAQGEVLASVNVAMPSIRFGDAVQHQIHRALQDAVGAIKRQIG